MKIVVLLFVTGCLSQPPFTGDAPGSGSGSAVQTSFVTAGAAHACAISSGTLRCWGAGELDQNGLGSDTGLPQVTPDQTGTWTEVAAGDNHTCGIEAGTVLCWGADQHGQGGTTPAATQTPVPVTLGGMPAVHVFAGGDATCAIDNQTQLWCWGRIHDEQMTPTLFAPQTSSVQLLGWTSVAIASDHACALTVNHDVWCWGDDSFDQLGGTGTVDMAHAVHKSGAFTAIAARPGSTCGARADDGSLACWGRGDFGLFLDAATAQTTEVTVDKTRAWAAIAIGAQHACAIDQVSAGVFCWGDDELGAEGKGLDTPVTSIPATSSIFATMIAVGEGFSCDIDRDSTSVYCWGANTRGQIGTGDIATTLLPTKVATNATKIAVGRDHACAQIGSGISCWGRNDSGLVPGNDSAFLTTPTPAFSPLTADQLVAGDRHTCLMTGGNAMCWGNNFEQQLATGATTFISAGGVTTCIKNGAQIKCWGLEPGGSTTPVMGKSYAAAWGTFAVNDGLAIGVLQADNKTISEFGIDPEASGPTTPTTIPLYSPYKDLNAAAMQFAVGYHFGCALVGAVGVVSVICWGANDASQCAAQPSDSSEASTFAPPGETTWMQITTDPQIAASDAHACAISNAGKLFCWGSNASLALGGTIDVMTATPVPMPIPNVRQVATGPLDTCAIDAEQNLYCWGYNEYGEVGNGARFYGEPVLTKYP